MAASRARHTLYKTIQNEMEKERGAGIEVMARCKVSHIDAVPGGDGFEYTVRFKSFEAGEEGRRTSATAPTVFLAAGCLGTSEILLRSKEVRQRRGEGSGLDLSPKIGYGFSTNGDFLGFTYDLPRDYQTSSKVPDGERIGNANPTVGPINASHFYLVFDKNGDRVDVNVEDAGIPTVFARLVHDLLPHFDDFEKFVTLGKALLKILFNRDPFATHGPPDTEAREDDDYLTERELVADVFFYNLMGAGDHEPLGTFKLQSDGEGLDLSFDEKLADWPVFKHQEAVMRQLTEQMNDPGDDDRRAKPMLSSFWQSDEKRLTVVHPLGGAPIGRDATTGTINASGQVFRGTGGEVYDGLYVVDGAAIPGALGVNPTFTIVTQAIRSVGHALSDW